MKSDAGSKAWIKKKLKEAGISPVRETVNGVRMWVFEGVGYISLASLYGNLKRDKRI